MHRKLGVTGKNYGILKVRTIYAFWKENWKLNLGDLLWRIFSLSSESEKCSCVHKYTPNFDYNGQFSIVKSTNGLMEEQCNFCLDLYHLYLVNFWISRGLVFEAENRIKYDSERWSFVVLISSNSGYPTRQTTFMVSLNPTEPTENLPCGSSRMDILNSLLGFYLFLWSSYFLPWVSKFL